MAKPTPIFPIIRKKETLLDVSLEEREDVHADNTGDSHTIGTLMDVAHECGNVVKAALGINLVLPLLESNKKHTSSMLEDNREQITKACMLDGDVSLTLDKKEAAGLLHVYGKYHEVQPSVAHIEMARLNNPQ
ncbi:hypothetical protein AMTR_s00168p00046960, partial [Amborella trichopoda]